MTDTKTFKVPNIGCDGCVRTIALELNNQPGISKVVGEVDSQLVTVEWEQPMTWEQIVTVLKSIDYAPETPLMP